MRQLACGLLTRTAVTLEMIKVSHSVFALPFALAAVLLAADGWPPPRVLGWVIVAMVAARSAAMAFNRLVDARYDAANPRTRARALPAGRLGPRFVLGFTGLSLALFFAAAAALGPLCLALSPIAALVILGYSYAKRFTVLCHLWLGLALGLTPLAGWLAVKGVVDATIVTPLLLAGAVLLWVAGFDVIYSCQDVAFDREARLHSLPAALGRRRALNLSAVLHAGSFGLLIAAGSAAGLGAVYFAASGLVGALLVAEQLLARPGGAQRLQIAFFHVNSAVGLVILAAVVWETL